MDISAERSQLLASRAIEAAKLQALQAEIEQHERDALATNAFAPGYQEAKYLRDVQQRAVASLDARLEALVRRRSNEINRQFRRLALAHYPDADRLLEIARVAIDPEGGPA